MVGFGPGEITWRRNSKKSPWVSGEQLISAVKDTRTLALSMRTYGSSVSDLLSRMSNMLRMFEQFSYIFTITVNGQFLQYRCQPADYSSGEGGELSKFELDRYTQVTNFSIPSNPIPLLGGI